MEFKEKSWATTPSTMFQGGSYFYVRHSIIGLLEAIIETIAILSLATSTAVYFKAPLPLLAASPKRLCCAPSFRGLQKMVTALFSNKCVEDFIPKHQHVEVLTEQSAVL
jgi:hypothetical protein